MNRRKFFNMLGSAVIGTVIALKIPENIAPIKEFIVENRISFAVLNDAYLSHCFGYNYVKQIFVSNKTYSDINKMMKPQYRFRDTEAAKLFGNRNLKFHDAAIIPLSALEDDEVHTSGSIYRNAGRMKFLPNGDLLENGKLVRGTSSIYRLREKNKTKLDHFNYE